jgi:hypothetical protein
MGSTDRATTSRGPTSSVYCTRRISKNFSKLSAINVGVKIFERITILVAM